MPLKNSEDYYLKILFEKIKMKEVMVFPVITVKESDELSTAEELFIAHRISYLPVVSGEGKLVGSISHKYLYKTVAPRKILNNDINYDPKKVIVDGHSFYDREVLDQYILRQVMLKDPFCMGPDESLAKAVVNMALLKIGCIPIVDQNRRVIGIFTDQELINYTARIFKN